MEFKTYKRKLNSVLKSAKTQRDNVQELIIAGLEQYSEHGSCNYLTMLVQGCIGVRSLPTRSITAYIQAHANVTWAKLKDGTDGYKKKGKGVEVSMPDVTWYDWEGNNHNTVATEFDVLKAIHSLKKRYDKAVEKGLDIKHADLIQELDNLANATAKADKAEEEDKPDVFKQAAA